VDYLVPGVYIDRLFPITYDYLLAFAAADIYRFFRIGTFAYHIAQAKYPFYIPFPDVLQDSFQCRNITMNIGYQCYLVQLIILPFIIAFLRYFHSDIA
jgi:hypothetical protein